MTKIHANRLKKLADHLKKGKLGHKKFDFGEMNAGEFDERGCGTAGCALGECPIVFPKSWRFSGLYKLPCLSDRGLDCRCAAEDFFCLTSRESAHLFVPNCQYTKEFGGKSLYDSATRHQVAANIYAFLKVKGF